jgi:hypothetical protein
MAAHRRGRRRGVMIGDRFGDGAMLLDRQTLGFRDVVGLLSA